MRTAKAIALSLLISLPLYSCRGAPNRKVEQRLIGALEQKHNNSDKVIVTLKDIADFSWDRFYVFGPYTQPDDVKDALGFDWPAFEYTAVAHNDHHDLLVFVSEGRVVEYVEYPRRHGDFYKVKRRQGYTPEEAVFEVKIEEHGVPMPVPQESNGQ